MKPNLLLTLVLLFAGISAFGQFIGLKDIVYEPTEGLNPSVQSNSMGGRISFDRTYRSGCVGNYDISWKFSKDISTLEDGESFTITLNCEKCATPCGYKWGIANVFAANNVTKVPEYSAYTYNGNISQESTTANSSGIHDWSPGHLTHSYVFVYQKKKDARYTAFVFNFAGYKVYYVFEEGKAPSSSGTNCHALLGLGKTLYGLELGAYEGYGWEWMDTTIGHALKHLEAVGCLSSSYLKDLKSRMYQAPDTKVFLQEIRSYSQKVEEEVKTSCPACSNCSQ